MSDFDVVVVGASLAGCSAATLLAREGVRVALLESRPDPAAYKAMCTHFIQASATPALERLGLADRIEAAGGVRNGIVAWSRYGWIRPDPGPDAPHPAYGYDIRREKLDPMARELARETPGVEMMLGLKVVALLRDQDRRPGGVRAVDRDGAEREITARVVVAADGRDSDVARMAGVRARVKAHGRFAYFAYYRDLPLVTGERTLFWFLDPDVAYAFPQDDGITLLGLFQTKDRLPWFKRDLDANFEAYFRGLPDAPDLARGRRVSKVMGKLELPNKVRTAGHPGLAFIGDAAMAADPLWGVGCGFAFQSSEWLAEALSTVLGRRGTDAEIDGALRRYARNHRRRLLGHFLLMSDYATGRRFSAAERLIYSAGAKDAVAADAFHAFGTRSVRPTDREFVALLARATWVNATRRRALDPVPLTGAHEEGAPPPAAARRSRLDVAGVEVPLSSVGADDASEAVVFVHGNPGSSRDWDDLLSRTARFARGVAFDMPGFGRAGTPRDFAYTVEAYAEFLEAALRALGIDRAHLVLHDFGGPWGLEWATRNPAALASAVLVNTGVLPGYRWHYLARIWQTPVLGELFQATTTRGGMRTVLRHGNPRGLPRAFVDRMYDDADSRTRRAVLRLYRSTPDPSALAQRQIDALRGLDVPALVVWGAHDPYLPAALAERQREAFPRVEVAVLAESGHWPFADDPVEVGRIVEPFLREQAGSPPEATEAPGEEERAVAGTAPGR